MLIFKEIFVQLPEHYYCVSGQVLRGRGFKNVADSIYCKVRIDK